MKTHIYSIEGYDPEQNTTDYSSEHFEKYEHTYVVNGDYIPSGTYGVVIRTEDNEKITLLVNKHNPASVLPNREIHIRLASYQEGDIPCFWLNNIVDPLHEEQVAKEDKRVQDELYRAIRSFYRSHLNTQDIGSAIVTILNRFEGIEPNDVCSALEDEWRE
ncbi:hypothetical protein BXY85_1291 [Roseivirga pacifica]|uniref:Uncharacterized protein n=1 Tax=Roseivirga pacifica TaxID=1267423 RepID=A0A1I0MDF8_9BACT|nr:hypothetical protein [Roseivirga pacifica]RKQ50277.1 hypothetical protein BXY85_1291 [Roseivirga pacifica]SEV85994.1 hypothetical protein SAMN05216290_0275 [Roseivirga pacifica]